MEVLSPTLKRSMPEEGDVQIFSFFVSFFVVVFCCQCVFSLLSFRGHVVGSEVVMNRRIGFAHRNYCRKSFQWCEQLRCQWLQNRLNSWTCLHRNKKTSSKITNLTRSPLNRKTISEIERFKAADFFCTKINFPPYTIYIKPPNSTKFTIRLQTSCLTWCSCRHLWLVEPGKWASWVQKMGRCNLPGSVQQ